MEVAGRRGTDGTWRLFEAAREEAARLGAPAVGTEHLLLALLESPDERVRSAIGRLGLPAGKLAEAAVAESAKADGDVPRPLPLSAHVAQSLEAGAEAARRMGADRVDTEHVLLGLMKVGGRAGQALERCGLGLPEARILVMDALAVPDEARASLGAPRPHESAATEALYRAISEARKDAERQARVQEVTRVLPARELTAPGEPTPEAVAGRERELQVLDEVLSRADRQSLFVIGKQGSGRSTLLRAWARRLVERAGPGEPLRQVYLFEPELARESAPPVGMGEGAVVGRWLAELLARAESGVFVFRDFVSDEWIYDDFVEFVAPACERRWAQCVFLVTPEERRRIGRRWSALTNVTSEMDLAPLNRAASLEASLARVRQWPASERISVATTAVEAGVNLAEALLAETALPGAAIDILERTRDRVRREYAPRVPDLEASIDAIQKEVRAAVEAGRFEEAAHRRRERDRLLGEYDALIERRQKERGQVVIGTGEIVRTVAEITGKTEEEVRHAGAWGPA